MDKSTSEATDSESNQNSPSLDEIFEKVPFRYFQANNCIPIEINEDNDLVLGVNEDEFDPQIIDNLSLQLDRSVRTKSMNKDEINQTLNQMEQEVLAGRESGIDNISEDTIESFRSQVEEDRQRIDSSEEAPIASQINSIIADGVLNEVSDIHFEPRENNIRVRFRKDGILNDHSTLQKDILPGLISRIKVMANLDIAEQLNPQDGRMNLDVGNREVDVRVSIVPTVHGERAVLRILDKDTLKSSMSELGMRDEHTNTVQDLLSQSDGIILVTGPTGSGKTTSLYCFLQQLQESERNIVTLEDPVEYRLEGINQIEIKPEQGLTFASGLRSVLRQDPDIILVGEIRDRESAELAVHASLTGHLVFATLHTRSSVGALTRLVDLGLDSYMVGAGLNAVMAQRLIRTLCKNCREKNGKYYKPNGCAECSNTGYTGRTALFEILEMDEKIRSYLESESGEDAIWNYLNENNFKTLQDEGQYALENGVTDPSELNRVLTINE